MKILFPHEQVRPSQTPFLKKVSDAIKNGGNLLVHAPTGLGKTAAALAPALSEAIDNDMTVFFLTSRHTQHEIAMKTLEQIKLRHKVPFLAVDIIGKKNMCLQPGIEALPSSEFTEFCRALREDGQCSFFSKLRKGEKLTPDGEMMVHELKSRSPVRNSVIMELANKYGICPYYASMEVARSAKVIIGDYYYVFHPKVRDQFFARSNKELENSIIIVDEAHNLPSRIKNLSSARLSDVILKRAIGEAVKEELSDLAMRLRALLTIFERYSNKARSEKNQEVYVPREEFISTISLHNDYDMLVEDLVNNGDVIREKKQVSYIGAVGLFLESWLGGNEGFTRIFSIRKSARGEIASLSYRCLDPSLIAHPIISQAHSVILMSGTLTPTAMYKEVLGFDDAEEVTFPSPFPDKNKLSLIIPKTTTKYAARSEDQYREISEILVKSIAKIPGNVAVFFPSYYLLNQVNQYFQTSTERTVFVENPEMTTSEKQDFIDKFRGYSDVGAVLMGVISGSFGEGIDLPGDELKGVIVVGLPLQKPDLETESLIRYYDDKFGKGWDYGYLFPAFNKTLQSAGRCIRSETDRGVIIFLDERYAWPQYKRCFPPNSNVKISLLYEGFIEDFFKGG